MAKYKVGDSFIVKGCNGKTIKNYHDFPKKSIVKLYHDDGTSMPEFIGVDANGKETIQFVRYYDLKPYTKSINLIRRFINAIIGWFCDPDSHSVNRYN